MTTQNPFSETNSDRHYIWNMLVLRDTKAFLNCDWSMVEDDFIYNNFIGIDGCKSDNPDDWKFKFPDIESYKTEWLRQAQSFKEIEWAEDPEQAFFSLTELRDIEINNGSALVHKKFSGEIKRADGQSVSFQWRTVYYCRKVNDVWKIAGFNGYLPYTKNK